MSKSLVIDTNVIIHYIAQDLHYFESCEWIVFKIKEGEIKITIDHTEIIIKEYDRKIREYARNVSARILMNLIGRHRFNPTFSSIFEFVEPIDSKDIKKLKKIGFHDRDLIFVRVSPKSSSRKIISTDQRSFLKEKYKNWIKDELNVDGIDQIDYYTSLK